MFRKILAVSLVLAVVSSFAACAQRADGTKGLPSAEEIVVGVAEAFNKVMFPLTHGLFCAILICVVS
jgi:hypothetical protein